MTDIFGKQQKLLTKEKLFKTAVRALENEGWKVERALGSGKSSFRYITKNNIRKTVSIRTSQDTWIAFPRTPDNKGWATLADVDYVVAASVDSKENPHFAQVHLIDGDEMRDRFDRAYAARKAAGHALPVGRGMWVSLYEEEKTYPVNRVGAGAGSTNVPIAKVPLDGTETPTRATMSSSTTPTSSGNTKSTFTIAQAKALLAESLGVDESEIKITISS